MYLKRTILGNGVAIMLLWLVFAQPTLADSGLPMLAVMAPPMWGLLLLIVPLEALIAERILSIPKSKSLKVSAIANCVSTIVGVPLTWALLTACELTSATMPGFNEHLFGKEKYLFYLVTNEALVTARSAGR